MNKKYIGLLGTKGAIDTFGLEFDTAFSKVGRNTGNLVFQYAMTNLIDEEKRYFHWSSDVEIINKTCRVLVLPLANVLGPHSTYGRAANFLRKLDIPVVAVGLGAQSHVIGDAQAEKTASKISEGTKEWLHCLSECTETIFVRGVFSKKVCNVLGVDNVEEFGCPSNLISHNLNLGAEFYKNYKACPWRNGILNTGMYSTSKSNYKKIVEFERKLLATYGYGNLSFVAQAPEHAVKYAVGGGVLTPEIHDVFKDHVSDGGARLVSFFGYDAWSQYQKSYDFSIGTRAHGSMVALQNGSPAILVTHDSRTEELASTMRLPSFSLKEVCKSKKLDKLLSTQLAFSPDEYDRNRRDMASKLMGLFSTVGIKPAEHLKKLALS